MKKELALRQFDHLQKMDEALGQLKLDPDSPALKKKIFRNYYGATRSVRRVNGEIKITVDEGLINYLKGKLT